jgi:hypothetical protein
MANARNAERRRLMRANDFRHARIYRASGRAFDSPTLVLNAAKTERNDESLSERLGVSHFPYGFEWLRLISIFCILLIPVWLHQMSLATRSETMRILGEQDRLGC